jgi:phenylalanine-4-hydroxylase
MNNPSINNNIITISTINKMNFKEVKGYRNRIQTFISKELNNYLISVDVKLSEENTKKSYLDSKDKLDILIKNNPDIEKLIEDLKLRI